MTPDQHRETRDSCGCSRRGFLGASGVLIGQSLLARRVRADGESENRPVASAGPGAKYSPRLRVAFVRRKEEYGMRWPGAVYDGEAALRKYRRQIEATGKELGLQVSIRPTPIHSLEESEAWLAESLEDRPDGLLVVLLDRQRPAWPVAVQAVESGVPTVLFAPVGAAFTTNTESLADKNGVFICSTDDFGQAAYGMKMIRAAAKLREMRFIVLKGKQRRDETVSHFGTKLRRLPAQMFLDEYRQTPTTKEIEAMAAEYVSGATRISGPTVEDVRNGVKSFVVARRIMEREEGDGITMDCLGALGRTNVSLPCIAWSRMLDHGVPAACEADIGAALTHALVQLLFDRPGFQQDPVPETAKEAIIGAHCTCPTRLHGFAAPAEPYYLSHHHGMRDAVPRPTWRIGQRVTVADILLPEEETPRLIISSGTVIENIAVPPSGGCVVSVMVRLDGVSDVLAYPGFHQLFFYGDYKKELRAYCKLFGMEADVV